MQNLASFNRIMALTAAGVLVASCGGGSGSGGGSTPVVNATPAGIATAAAKANVLVTLRYPANFHHARKAASVTSAAGGKLGSQSAPTRGKQYVNPTPSNLLHVLVDGTDVTGSGIPLSTATANPDGSQTIGVSVLSGVHNFEVQEVDTSSNVLADGSVSAITVNLGSPTTLTVTMEMNATYVALTSDPVAGADSLVLSTSSYTVFCMPLGATHLYAFAADPSTGFVTPGTPAGFGGVGNSGYPGIPTPALGSQSSGGTSTLASSAFGFTTVFDGPLDPINANFNVTNPLAISNPAVLGYPSTTSYGYATVSASGSTNCPAGQVLTEYPIPTGGSTPAIIVKGPDGNLWFTEQAGNKIGKITPFGTITEYPVPTGGANPFSITVGVDGNLWFTEPSANQIGKITTAGAITEYTVPTGASQPTDIVGGLDGNLWFTEFNANKIGVSTTGGSITEYTIPTASSQPFGIALGRDGNVWFAEYGAVPSKIGRVTNTGVFAEFTTPTATAQPYLMTLGPDGNIWFTENGAPNVGKITSSGAATEYAVTSLGNKGISAGQDGNIWFSSFNNNQIGQMTPGGSVTYYNTSGGVVGISEGPDGNLWFIDNATNAVGKIRP